MKKTAIICCIILGMICILLGKSSNENKIILYEICCKNENLVYDPAGQYSDYIVLYNTSENEIDLENYFLSDSDKDLYKYKFPSVRIKGKEKKVIWANTITAYKKGFISEDVLYCGFSISENEKIYLSNPAGNVIDSVQLPLLGADSVYVRNIEENKWNILAKKEEKRTINAQEPRFSHESGFYEENFWLSMECEDGRSIYYTLDGSIPTENSFKYEKPILIQDSTNQENRYSAIDDIAVGKPYIPNFKVDKCVVVRAVSIDESGNYSEEQITSYFMNYSKRYGYEGISVISLITDPDNLFGYERGIYVKGKLYYDNKQIQDEKQDVALANYEGEGKGWEREAYIEYFDEKRTEKESEKIRIRIHGKNSIRGSQKSFNLYAEEGETNLLSNVFGPGYTTLVLRNGGNANRAKLRDVLGQLLVQDRKVHMQDYTPCQVFINGEYWGLYNIRERVGGNYFKVHYGIDEEDVLLIKNNVVIEGEKSDIGDYNRVVGFIKDNDMSDEFYYTQVEKKVDIQNYINYYCTEIYVANIDSIENNVAIWKTKTISDKEMQDGKLRWMVYDLDASVNSEERTKPEIDSFTSEGHYNGLTTPMTDEVLVSLLENQRFKRKFVTTFMDMANYNFDKNRVAKIVEELQNLYCEPCVLSHRRFMNEDYCEEDYLKEIDEIKHFYNNRREYIVQHLTDNLELSGDLERVILEIPEIDGGSVMLNTLKLDLIEKFSGEYFREYPIVLEVSTENGYVFDGWVVNGKFYSADKRIELDMNTSKHIIPQWRKK